MKTITIDGVEYTPKQSHDDKPLVLVRTFSAGVHVGRLAKRDGREVTLADSRRIWSWKGANTLSEVAAYGVGSGSKISQPVASILLTEAIEIIPVMLGAVESLTVSGWPK
ncbi:MAG: hypothetical protein DRH30_07860 [Deltaproteobacteria bacterium]|nr:MAG: hypothetical protein DRH30_07860 [Deltaproteobacteria bacterium]